MDSDCTGGFISTGSRIAQHQRQKNKHEACKNTVYLIITVVKDKIAAISLYCVFVSDKPLNVLMLLLLDFFDRIS